MPTRRATPACTSWNRGPARRPACGCAERAVTTMLQPAAKPRRKPRWPLRRPTNLLHLADGWDSRHTSPPSRPAAAVTPVREYPDTRWDDEGPTRGVEAFLEDGGVLSFPQLAFALSESERRFLDE